MNLGLSHGPRAAGEQEWEPKDGDGQGEASENLNVIPSKLIYRRRRQVLTELTTQLGRGIAHRGCDSQRDGWAGSWEGFPMPNSPGGSGMVMVTCIPRAGWQPQSCPSCPCFTSPGLGPEGCDVVFQTLHHHHFLSVKRERSREEMQHPSRLAMAPGEAGAATRAGTGDKLLEGLKGRVKQKGFPQPWPTEDGNQRELMKEQI